MSFINSLRRIKVWKSCGVKFKIISLTLAIYMALTVVTLSTWLLVSGHQAPSGLEAVLFLTSIQLAKIIGKKQSWL